jgi:hypothetical protein
MGLHGLLRGYIYLYLYYVLFQQAISRKVAVSIPDEVKFFN